MRCSFIITVVAIVASLTSFGCTQASSEPEPELEATQSSALTRQEGDALVAELAFDPAFVAFAQRAIATAGQSRAALAALTSSQRGAALATANGIVAAVKAGTPATELMPSFTALTTITQAQMTDLRTRAATLVAGHPDLHTTGPALFGEAIEHNPMLRAALVASAEPADDVEGCLRQCEDERRSAHNLLVGTYAFDLGVCAITSVFPPVFAACMLGAAAAMTAGEAIVMNNFDNCQDECLGIEQWGECRGDNECASNEWCDTGTLHIGDNACKPDKAIGKVCSRGAKCLSGCCKFDFFQNPVSQTCNPANDCN